MRVRCAILLFASLIATIGAAPAPAANSPSAAPQSFTVTLTLAPPVQAYARQAGKPVTLEVWYNGEAKPQFAEEADAESGLFSLGHERVNVPLSGGALTFGGGLDRKTLSKLAKPVRVSIQAWVGGPQTIDRYLECTFAGKGANTTVQGMTFAALAQSPQAIICNRVSTQP